MQLPGPDCPLCPRLTAFRAQQRAAYPNWHNAPVPPFGSTDAALLVVGLAPGLRGANRTGRPFTGDYAGDLLYSTLKEQGFAQGEYGARPDDGFALVNCRVTNAVRCLPPQNKPTGGEISTCRPFLSAEIGSMARLRVIVALGRVAHESVLRAFDLRPAAHPFGHNRTHRIGTVTLFDSYHCSRYNTQTGRLTESMFREVFVGVRDCLATPPGA